MVQSQAAERSGKIQVQKEKYRHMLMKATRCSV
jgi:hypothetical protein